MRLLTPMLNNGQKINLDNYLFFIYFCFVSLSRSRQESGERCEQNHCYTNLSVACTQLGENESSSRRPPFVPSNLFVWVSKKASKAKE
jgi:hypothetical protein